MNLNNLYMVFILIIYIFNLDNNIESYYIDNEESLENNINTYLKMYNCLVNLIEGMRKVMK